jgi:hypothetical protein
MEMRWARWTLLVLSPLCDCSPMAGRTSDPVPHGAETVAEPRLQASSDAGDAVGQTEVSSSPTPEATCSAAIAQARLDGRCAILTCEIRTSGDGSPFPEVSGCIGRVDYDCAGGGSSTYTCAMRPDGGVGFGIHFDRPFEQPAGLDKCQAAKDQARKDFRCPNIQGCWNMIDVAGAPGPRVAGCGRGADYKCSLVKTDGGSEFACKVAGRSFVVPSCVPRGKTAGDYDFYPIQVPDCLPDGGSP